MKRSHRLSAFSLLELLVVIAIILILMSLCTVAVQHMVRGVELTSSIASVQDMLNLARQTALSTNSPVEVRIYKVPPKNSSLSAGGYVYRAIGIYQIEQSVPKQLGKLTFLQGTMRLSDTAKFGTLLQFTPESKSTLPSVDPSGKTEFTYRYFQYRSDGSTSLDATAPAPGGGDTWHVMVHGGHDDVSGGVQPANFGCIQLDPATGRTEFFQPGR